MTRYPKPESPDNKRGKDASKIRQCLRCKASFQSEWSGERICPRCKGTSSWKNGVPSITPSFQR